MKKGFKIAIVLLIILLILLIIAYVVFYFSSNYDLRQGPITFSPIAVMQDGITINSPLDTTYNFDLSNNYTIDLNVSAEFTVDSWWYTLWDLEHQEIIREKVPFTPDTHIEVVRGQNLLSVSTYSSKDELINHANVSFYVSVPNHAPVVEGIEPLIYICGGKDSYLEQEFTVTDIEEDIPTLSIVSEGPFYVRFIEEIDLTKGKYELYSEELDDKVYSSGENGQRVYEARIYASDKEYAGSAATNIAVIETNTAPKIQPIGVQTIIVKRGQPWFYKEVKAADLEDFGESSNLFFSLSFGDEERLFDITDKGVMEFIPDENHIGAYEISVCVTDSGLENPYPDIFEKCGETGESKTTCETFYLAITDKNKAPTITDFSPKNLNFGVLGTESLKFEISTYDPEGVIPDTYWYVDDVLQKYESGSENTWYEYSFGCNVSGTRIVRAEISDGLFNDSLEWEIDVDYSECVPVGEEESDNKCPEKWACKEWSVCQNAERSLGSGILFKEDYDFINTECEAVGLYEGSCGVQIRECFDINKCGTFEFRPYEFQSCHYTENPSCFDGIKNCHRGKCELLIDCGGPCLPCSSCSDGIQNQGEEGIDCGSPCILRCEVEVPLLRRKVVQLSLIIILSLIFIILIRFRRILESLKRLREEMRN